MEAFNDRIEQIRNALAEPGKRKRQGSKEYRVEHPEYTVKVDETTRRWRADNLERSKKYHRERKRRNFITITREGKQVSARIKGKRPWPGSCELCGKINCILQYHHWDDSNPSKGLWLCMTCHRLAEIADSGAKTERYLELKNQVSQVAESSGVN